MILESGQGRDDIRQSDVFKVTNQAPNYAPPGERMTSSASRGGVETPIQDESVLRHFFHVQGSKSHVRKTLHLPVIAGK